LLTAWLVYQLGLLLLGKMWHGWGAALAAVLYLFSYNTVWCDVVARPDALVAFFAVAGLWCYYRSDFGEKPTPYWLAAILLGLAGGLKLHACLFVVFIVLDMVRVRGFRHGIKLAAPWAVVAVVFFALSAGTPIFDPLKYVKLRLTNMADDESPWIQWGEQFFVMVKGSGWLVLPAAVLGIWGVFGQPRRQASQRMRSLLFLVACWLVLFASIRQLRGYWMVPVLPLFYLTFLDTLRIVRRAPVRGAVIGVVLVAMIAQTVQETRQFQAIPFGNLRTWIQQNIRPDEPFFVFGYEAVELPKTVLCRQKTQAGIVRGIASDIAQGESHVRRHLKNWEEETTLALFDMLAGGPDSGFAYYSMFGTPLDKYLGIIALDDMKYLFFQQGFLPGAYGLSANDLAADFVELTDLTGPGGGGAGLTYRVYARKTAP